MTAAQPDATASIRGKVTHRIFLGASAEYSISVPGLGDLLVFSDRAAGGPVELFEPGTEVDLEVAAEAPRIFWN
jgi:spermidine/putrescine transport system ATP-binding protein